LAPPFRLTDLPYDCDLAVFDQTRAGSHAHEVKACLLDDGTAGAAGGEAVDNPAADVVHRNGSGLALGQNGRNGELTLAGVGADVKLCGLADLGGLVAVDAGGGVGKVHVVGVEDFTGSAADLDVGDHLEVVEDVDRGVERVVALDVDGLRVWAGETDDLSGCAQREGNRHPHHFHAGVSAPTGSGGDEVVLDHDRPDLDLAADAQVLLGGDAVVTGTARGVSDHVGIDADVTGHTEAAVDRGCVAGGRGSRGAAVEFDRRGAGNAIEAVASGAECIGVGTVVEDVKRSSVTTGDKGLNCGFSS